MKRIIGILVFVLLFCGTGQVFASPPEYGQNALSAKAVNDLKKLVDKGIRMAIKAKEQPDLADKRSDFYNHLNKTIGTTQPVADKQDFSKKLAAYYRKRPGYESLIAWCELAESVSDYYDALSSYHTPDPKTLSKLRNTFEEKYEQVREQEKASARANDDWSPLNRQASIARRGHSRLDIKGKVYSLGGEEAAASLNDASADESDTNRSATQSVTEESAKAAPASTLAAFKSNMARLFKERPTLGPTTARAILEETARELGDKGKDNEYGSGRLRGMRAVRFANQ